MKKRPCFGTSFQTNPIRFQCADRFAAHAFVLYHRKSIRADWCTTHAAFMLLSALYLIPITFLISAISSV